MPQAIDHAPTAGDWTEMDWEEDDKEKPRETESWQSWSLTDKSLRSHRANIPGEIPSGCP